MTLGFLLLLLFLLFLLFPEEEADPFLPVDSASRVALLPAGIFDVVFIFVVGFTFVFIFVFFFVFVIVIIVIIVVVGFFPSSEFSAKSFFLRGISGKKR